MKVKSSTGSIISNEITSALLLSHSLLTHSYHFLVDSTGILFSLQMDGLFAARGSLGSTAAKCSFFLAPCNILSLHLLPCARCVKNGQ